MSERDPVFQTWAEVEAWADTKRAMLRASFVASRREKHMSDLARVLAAHAHLKENTDG